MMAASVGQEGAARVQAMLDAGAPADQVAVWRSGRRQQMIEAGAPVDQVDHYWGVGQDGVDTLDKHVADNVAALPPADRAKIAQNPVEALAAGFDMSASGLLRRKPQTELGPEAGIGQKIAAGVGQIAGDIPFMIAGGLGGAAAGSELGPVGSRVGMNVVGAALPEAVRQVMKDHYDNPALGKATWGEIGGRATSIAWETAKAAIAGGVGGEVGAAAGTAASGAFGRVLGRFGSVMGPGIKVGAEAAGMAVGGAGASAALNLEMPTSEDFATGAILMLGLAGSGHIVAGTKRFVPSPAAQQVGANLNNMWAKTGVSPRELVDAAQNDPALRSEIMANVAADGSVVAPAHDQIKRPDPAPYKVPPNPEVSAKTEEAHAAGPRLPDEEKTVTPDETKVKPTYSLPKEAQPGLTYTPRTPVPPGGHAVLSPAGALSDDFVHLFYNLEGNGKEQASYLTSPAGAQGRGQIIPTTASQYGFD